MKLLPHILFWGIVGLLLALPRVAAQSESNASFPVPVIEYAQAKSVATSTEPVATTTPPTIKELVQMAFGTTSVMVKVAECESHFRQFDKAGVPLKNPHSSATGVFQIMFSLHNATALSKGWDVKTTEGNLAFAKYLYTQSGTTPWNASKHCWGKI